MLDCEHENQGHSSQTCSSPNAFAGSYRDSFSVVENDEIYCTEMKGVPEIPAYSADTSFPEANSSSIAVCGDNLNLSQWKSENESQIKNVRDDVEFERM